MFRENQDEVALIWRPHPLMKSTIDAMRPELKADYEDIPQALIDAAVAIEDKRFYEHQGVDWFTTIKAFANMFFGESTVGGSSMTQQLVKNVTKDDSVTVQRKVQEFFRATLVEKNYDKKGGTAFYAAPPFFYIAGKVLND